MESGSVFKVLKKFMGGQEKKRTLLENARGVVKRDHLLGQLQAKSGGSSAIAAPTAAEPLVAEPFAPEPMAEVVETPAPREAPASLASKAPEKTRRKHGRPKKPAKKPIPEQAASAFGFMTEIDLDLRGVAVEIPPPPELQGLPPDFEDKLRHLRDLMDF